MSLDETVIPVAIVAALDGDPYRSEPRTWMWPQTITSTGAILGTLEVSNPAGSAQLIVVKGFFATPNATGNNLQWGITRGVAGVLTAGISQPVLLNSPNGFLGAPGQSATRFRSGQNVSTENGLIGTLGADVVNRTTFIHFEDPVVLFPGDLFWIQAQLIAVAWGLTIMGAEYVQTAP